MGLGGCVALLAVGAILTFATDWELRGVDLNAAGLVLMAAGLIGIVAFTSVARRRVVVPGATTVVDGDPGTR
ncbi:hypothetical protein JNUCC64_17815 [Streptomyces sp. JNUCC 64]